MVTLREDTGRPFSDLYQGIGPTIEVAGKMVPYSEEEQKPILIFNLMDCKVPLSKALGELFNSGFYLSATAYLSNAATLFFGVQATGNGGLTIMGSTGAACATYPCEGLVDVKWMIGREPTMAELLQMVGLQPVPGTYEIIFSIGYLEEDETPVATDSILVTFQLTETRKDLTGLIVPAAVGGLGLSLFLV